MAGTYLGQPECSQNSCVPQGPSFDLTLAGVQVFPNTDAPALLESLTHCLCLKVRAGLESPGVWAQQQCQGYSCIWPGSIY